MIIYDVYSNKLFSYEADIKVFYAEKWKIQTEVFFTKGIIMMV